MTLRNISLNAEQQRALANATSAEDVVNALGILNRHFMVPHTFGSSGVHTNLSANASGRSAFQLADEHNPDRSSRLNSSAAHSLWSDFSRSHNLNNSILNTRLRNIFRAAADCSLSDADHVITGQEWHSFRSNQLGAAAVNDSNYSDSEFIAAVALARFLDAEESELSSGAAMSDQLTRLTRLQQAQSATITTLSSTIRGLAPTLVPQATTDLCTGANGIFNPDACSQVSTRVHDRLDRAERAVSSYESHPSTDVSGAIKFGAFAALIGLGFAFGRIFRSNRTAPTPNEVSTAIRSVPTPVLNAEIELLGWNSRGVPTLPGNSSLPQRLVEALEAIASNRASFEAGREAERTQLVRQMVEGVFLPLQERLRVSSEALASANARVQRQDAELASLRNSLDQTARAGNDIARTTEAYLNALLTERSRLQSEVQALQERLNNMAELLRSVQQLFSNRSGNLRAEPETIPAITTALRQLENAVRTTEAQSASLAGSTPTVVMVNRRVYTLPMSSRGPNGITVPINPVQLPAAPAAAAPSFPMRSPTLPGPESPHRAPTVESPVPLRGPAGTRPLPPSPTASASDPHAEVTREVPVPSVSRTLPEPPPGTTQRLRAERPAQVNEAPAPTPPAAPTIPASSGDGYVDLSGWNDGNLEGL